MSFQSLIIFDYSGTLSIEAPAFAASDSLLRNLQECGLYDFGVSTPDIFWKELVNPTWIQGSTTALGYKQVLQERINAKLQPDMPAERRGRLEAAVGAFVDRYLDRSRIHAQWIPVLRKLIDHKDANVIIATDHYAEATGAIINFLAQRKITALKATAAVAADSSGALFVANSADIGFHKDNPSFWRILKANIGLNDIRRIFLVDDFGGNEDTADAYNREQKTGERRQKTLQALQDVFAAPVTVFAFVLGADCHERDTQARAMIGKAAAAVEAFLMSG